MALGMSRRIIVLMRGGVRWKSCAPAVAMAQRRGSGPTQSPPPQPPQHPQTPSQKGGTAPGAGGGTGMRIRSEHRRVTPLFRRVSEHTERVAVRDADGEYTYGGLLTAAVKLAQEITGRLRGRTQERVLVVFPNDAGYVVALWACWISGQIAVPIKLSQTPTMMEHYVNDCESGLILAPPSYETPLKEIVAKVGCKLHIFDDRHRKEAMRPTDTIKGKTDKDKSKRPGEGGLLMDDGSHQEEIGQSPEFYDKSDALILYTSGTTGMPKGVVLSYGNLEARMKSTVEAWEWRSRDCLLHAFPLNHPHSNTIVDSLLSPLSVGARCVMMKEFDSAEVWAELTGVQKSAVDRVNVVMGAPRIYARLIHQYDASLTKSERMMDYIKSTCLQKIRLMTCSSYPLPKWIFERWEEMTGHRLLERYSSVETGIVFSNPLHGLRLHGSTGTPVPGVYVRVMKESDSGGWRMVAEGSNIGTRLVRAAPATTSGLLEVRGDTIFTGYYKKADATLNHFTPDGWFKTGDLVEYDGAEYRVLGRKATDIVKSGGFKVSTLDVETALMENKAVSQAVVIGLQDPTWGHRLVAVVVPEEGRKLTEEEVKTWARDKLPEYAVPSLIKVVTTLPTNAVGRVNKMDIANAFFTTTTDKKSGKKGDSGGVSQSKPQ